MKPIFCIDVTQNENIEVLAGDEFIVKTVPKKLMDALDTAQEKLDDSIEKTKLPLPMRIIQYVAGFLSLLLLLFLLLVFVESLHPDFPFAELLANRKPILMLAFVFGLIWLALTLASKAKQKIVTQEQDIDGKKEQVDDQVAMLYDFLGVPKDAFYVDVLMFSYALEDGVVVLEQDEDEANPFAVNMDMRAYVQNGMLCLADVENLHAFKLEEMKAIRTVKQQICMFSWNKKEDIKSEAYMPYKLKKEDTGTVLVKPYHVLEFEHNGEPYGIYFPCYELPAFERLTGLRAEAEQD